MLEGGACPEGKPSLGTLPWLAREEEGVMAYLHI